MRKCVLIAVTIFLSSIIAINIWQEFHPVKDILNLDDMQVTNLYGIQENFESMFSNGESLDEYFEKDFPENVRKSNPKHWAEVRVDIEGQVREMTWKEFKERLLK